jgi:hypothetical protein
MLRLFASRETGSLLSAEFVLDRTVIDETHLLSLCIVKGLKPQELVDLDVAPIVRECCEQLEASLSGDFESISGENLALWMAQQRPFEWLEVGKAPSRLHKHFASGKHVPLKDLAKKISELPADKPVVLSSQTGRSAKRAFQILKKSHQVLHLDGGISALEFLID